MTDPRRTAIVQYALSQVGPGDIPAYWASCGISPAPDPHSKSGQWCGAFALACLHAALVATDVVWKVGLGFIYPQHLSVTKSPQPGDILYSSHYQHHGVVESFDHATGTLTSIEGNTPSVARKVHTDLTGFTFYSIGKFLGEVETPHFPGPGEVPPVGAGGSDVQGLLCGVDVSHHNPPGSINYAALAKTRRFLIVRATYGSQIDETFTAHVQRAQDVGLVIGAYAFFRASQPVADQLDAFASAVGVVGMGPGWLPPALDVEANQQYDGPVTTDRYAPAEQVLRAWREQYGAAMVYTNISTASEIGNPTWLSDYLLWIAHFDVQHPTTPRGAPWTLWQHHVGVLPGVSPGPLDQDVAHVLPLLKEHDPAAPLLLAVDWDSLRADRDALIKEQDA